MNKNEPTYHSHRESRLEKLKSSSNVNLWTEHECRQFCKIIFKRIHIYKHKPTNKKRKYKLYETYYFKFKRKSTPRHYDLILAHGKVWMYYPYPKYGIILRRNRSRKGRKYYPKKMSIHAFTKKIRYFAIKNKIILPSDFVDPKKFT